MQGWAAGGHSGRHWGKAESTCCNLTPARLLPCVCMRCLLGVPSTAGGCGSALYARGVLLHDGPHVRRHVPLGGSSPVPGPTACHPHQVHDPVAGRPLPRGPCPAAGSQTLRPTLPAWRWATPSLPTPSARSPPCESLWAHALLPRPGAARPGPAALTGPAAGRRGDTAGCSGASCRTAKGAATHHGWPPCMCAL